MHLQEPLETVHGVLEAVARVWRSWAPLQALCFVLVSVACPSNPRSVKLKPIHRCTLRTWRPYCFRSSKVRLLLSASDGYDVDIVFQWCVDGLAASRMTEQFLVVQRGSVQHEIGRCVLSEILFEQFFSFRSFTVRPLSSIG